ncbi:MAG: glycosyltransferase, partial [Candidatus Marinimicrobia bacterium]|nr:glycosyltransferase [Candidatus Neomarinimicrobiota bacterium]
EKFPEAELHIAGDGPQKKYLADLVSELDLESGVVFHGMLQRQDVFKLMRSCDLFALSSDFETFGVVLIEAMSCGLPIVATRCGGPESIITEDWLGILTERDDNSFTKGLMNGVKEVQNKRFDSQRISTHVRDTYSYQAIGKMMTNLYLTSTLFI